MFCGIAEIVGNLRVHPDDSRPVKPAVGKALYLFVQASIDAIGISLKFTPDKTAHQLKIVLI